MATSNRKDIESAIGALSALKGRVGDDEQATLEHIAELLSHLDGEVARLSEQVRWLAGSPYRKKSEAAPPGQLAFDLIQMLTKRLDDEDKLQSEPSPDPEPDSEPSEDPKAQTKAKRKRRGRELPIEVVESRLPPEERPCRCCGKNRDEIGFDPQQRYVHAPERVFVLEERRYKYACRRCGEGVETADAALPAKPISGSMASSSMLAHLATSKILDGTPIERSAKKQRRHGVDLATSTLNDWLAAAADILKPLHRQQKERLRECELVSLDDTTMPAQNRSHAKNVQTGRQWLYLGDVDRVVYAEFSSDWKGIHPRRVLEGFTGDVQNDGYAGINPLFARDGPRRVGCNDHARRKFVQALERGDKRAQQVVDIYRALYEVERRATECELDAARRGALRRAESVPLWSQLAEVVTELSLRAEPKAPLGKAITYWNRQHDSLRAFLDDGRLPISNAHVERLIRLVAIFRKNSLFVGSLEAGHRYAVLLTLLLECLLADVNPYNYLVDVIDKIANDWPAARIGELLPRAWLQARQAEK